MCIIQLLLGNVGVAGGGINALRGAERSRLYQRWCHYGLCSGLSGLADPAEPSDTGCIPLKETYADGYYMNKPKFMVSMLKEWYGDNATAENNYCYDLLPKRSLKHNDSTYSDLPRMAENQIKGYLVWGMNPADSEPNTKYCREVLGKLDWMIVADWFATGNRYLLESPRHEA